MSSVIQKQKRFMSAKCPVSSLAEHYIYGLCYVIATNGYNRKIEVLVPHGDSIRVRVANVHVRSLTEVDPKKDMGGRTGL
jgi:hypothetical protein